MRLCIRKLITSPAGSPSALLRPPAFCGDQGQGPLQGELDLPVPEGQAALLQAPDARWRVWASLRLYRGILDVIEQHDYDVFNHRA